MLELLHPTPEIATPPSAPKPSPRTAQTCRFRLTAEPAARVVQVERAFAFCRSKATRTRAPHAERSILETTATSSRRCEYAAGCALGPLSGQDGCVFGTSKGTALVVAAALGFVACSSDGKTMAPRTTTTPTTAQRSHAADVVRIETTAFPEGPQLALTRADSDRAVFALLPAELPSPLPQPEECRFGNYTTLVLSDSSSVRYGPCARPEAIDRIRCAIADAPAPCP